MEWLEFQGKGKLIFKQKLSKATIGFPKFKFGGK